MLGEFRDGHPRLRLTVLGAGVQVDIEFIVDTGFEGDLALPTYLADQLGDSPVGTRRRLLANGAMIRCPFYEASTEWDGELRDVEVVVLEGNPLLGTALLDGYLLEAEITEGGGVEIEPL